MCRGFLVDRPAHNAPVNTSEAAATLGVSENAILRAVKKTGMRWRLSKVQGAYVFDREDIIALARVVKRRRTTPEPRREVRRTLPADTYCPDNGE